MESIRLIIAAYYGRSIYHLDIAIAFLNGFVEDEVFMRQPLGYIQPDNEHFTCKLHRSLYELKQSPRMWYSRLDIDLRRCGMKKTNSNPSVYYLRIGPSSMIHIFYIDDLFLTSFDFASISAIQNDLGREYKMTTLGLMKKFLRVQVLQTTAGILLHQIDCLEHLKRFNCRR